MVHIFRWTDNTCLIRLLLIFALQVLGLDGRLDVAWCIQAWQDAREAEEWKVPCASRRHSLSLFIMLDWTVCLMHIHKSKENVLDKWTNIPGWLAGQLSNCFRISNVIFTEVKCLLPFKPFPTCTYWLVFKFLCVYNFNYFGWLNMIQQYFSFIRSESWTFLFSQMELFTLQR